MVGHTFCLLEKQQQLNWFYTMEIRVDPLFKASMARQSAVNIPIVYK